MLLVRLLARCSIGTTRGFSNTSNGGVFRKQISGRSNISMVKRPYQTKTNAWRTWDAVVKAPGITKAESTGRVIVGGASLAGIAALCYYGLGLSNEIGAIDRASLWPKVVRERIQATYGYFAGSLVVTAMSAYGIARSRFIGRWVAASPWLTIGGSIIAMIGTSVLCASLPYEPGINGKHLAWLSHNGVVGLVIAPLMLLGGPLVVRAAACTAGVVASLSLTAACAPSDKFLNWGGPLAIGLGGIFVASIGTLFLPASGAVGAGLQAVVTYGGLVVFGGFMLYDTQKIIKLAETYPVYGERVYDPIQASMGIYMDTINIFIRILIIMANSSGSRRK